MCSFIQPTEKYFTNLLSAKTKAVQISKIPKNRILCYKLCYKLETSTCARSSIAIKDAT